MQSQSIVEYDPSKIHAPDNSGFTHTSPTEFTYFSGSDAGVRKTFGLPCEELYKLVEKVVQSFIQKFGSDAVGNAKTTIQELKNLVLVLVTHLENLKHNKAYVHFGDLANAVVASGHIPIIMEAGSPAQKFERAARSITPTDLSIYFENVPSAYEQCREYVIKQIMMEKIISFRKKVVDYRYNDPVNICFYNNLITYINKQIIEVNQKSLPSECEYFYLYETFRRKIHHLMCQMPDEKGYYELYNTIGRVLASCQIGTTYQAQSVLSDSLYNALQNFVEKTIKISSKAEDCVELTLEQDNHLQAILPLVALLNSPKNPFARNGLFGKVVSSGFHSKALKAYESHESQQQPKYREKEDFRYKKIARENTDVFDGDQIDKLLYGGPEVNATTSFLQSIGNSMRQLLSYNGNQHASSESSARRDRLALPEPEKYLLLEHVQPQPSPSNPKMN